MGRFDNKVAFITGAARGQGRSHAVHLAREGARIIGVDALAQVASVPYPLSTAADLAETVRLVEDAGSEMFSATADVRDYDGLAAALAAGVERFGRLDIVCANAGILTAGRMDVLAEQAWQDMIDINLTGVWHTAKAAIPHLRTAGPGGSIVITGSTSALRGFENIGHYVAAKHGTVGLMRTLAYELAADGIRVNIVHPTSVNTDMVHNELNYSLWAPDLAPEERTKTRLTERFVGPSLLPVPWVEAEDISKAIVYLASEDARYVTGTQLTVDAGLMVK